MIDLGLIVHYMGIPEVQIIGLFGFLIGGFFASLIADWPRIWTESRATLARARYVLADAEIKEALARQELAKASECEARAMAALEHLEQARGDQSRLENLLSLTDKSQEPES